MKKLLFAVISSALLIPAQASASLIYQSNIFVDAQGFGNAPKDLTLQETGRRTGRESGCVSVTGGFAVGPDACMKMDAQFDGNGFVNLGGDEPPPLVDMQKYGAPFESELGISSAADIGVLFNSTDPAGNSINVVDVTLKLYNNGGLVGSIDGSFNFDMTQPGTGSAGFVFVVSADEQAYINTLLALGDIRFALEATVDSGAGGSENFTVLNINAPRPPGDTVPEPTTMALLGLGLLGAGFARRRQQ